MNRTYVYVDGFNLYYGSLKQTEFKWLDLVKLAYQVLPSAHTVERLKYFTARVSGARDSGAPGRQQVYLNALATLPEVEIRFETFLDKAIWQPLLNLPVAGRETKATPPSRSAKGRILSPSQKPKIRFWTSDTIRSGRLAARSTESETHGQSATQ